MMESKKKKKDYFPPMIELQYVVLEDGIAAGSATLKPGTSDTPDIPEVHDWQDVDSADHSFEF